MIFTEVLQCKSGPKNNTHSILMTSATKHNTLRYFTMDKFLLIALSKITVTLFIFWSWKWRPPQFVLEIPKPGKQREGWREADWDRQLNGVQKPNTAHGPAQLAAASEEQPQHKKTKRQILRGTGRNSRRRPQGQYLQWDTDNEQWMWFLSTVSHCQRQRSAWDERREEEIKLKKKKTTTRQFDCLLWNGTRGSDNQFQSSLRLTWFPGLH